jgi:hypothetical protein
LLALREDEPAWLGVTRTQNSKKITEKGDIEKETFLQESIFFRF